jgi:hypothetical protein
LAPGPGDWSRNITCPSTGRTTSTSEQLDYYGIAKGHDFVKLMMGWRTDPRVADGATANMNWVNPYALPGSGHDDEDRPFRSQGRSFVAGTGTVEISALSGR